MTTAAETAVADAPVVIEAESAPARSILADVDKLTEDVAAISISRGDEDKAVRQGVSLLSMNISHLTIWLVEYYFADANLPYDRYGKSGLSLWLSIPHGRACFFLLYSVCLFSDVGLCGRFIWPTPSTGSPS